jgi:hypothetical protein
MYICASALMNFYLCVLSAAQLGYWFIYMSYNVCLMLVLQSEVWDVWIGLYFSSCIFSVLFVGLFVNYLFVIFMLIYCFVVKWQLIIDLRFTYAN